MTIFVASASFLKRALKNTWQAAWLQRQRLHEQLRVAASCGEPLSPAMHKLGMAVLTPNYINSYWASEHGAIILATSTFGNADQGVCARRVDACALVCSCVLPCHPVNSRELP